MNDDIRVKICGLRTQLDVQAAASAGAAYIGFNTFPKSPRYVGLDKMRELCLEVPVGIAKVALVVNADDDQLDALTDTVPLDMLQLHGHETPERVEEVGQRYGLPIIKVLGISDAQDLQKIDEFSDVSDQFLLDAKPPKGAILPGGNGITFDWRLLAGKKYWTKPWMLAGGLNVGNVAEAISRTGAQQVDVASGVESHPGIKDAVLMKAFVDAAKG